MIKVLFITPAFGLTTMRKLIALLALLWASSAGAANLAVDLAAVRPGPITVNATASQVEVHWKDERSRSWTAAFSLTAPVPTIASVEVEGKRIMERAVPFYRAETGKRRGGWDAFFDFPPSHPEGTRSFLAEFHPRQSASNRRATVSCWLSTACRWESSGVAYATSSIPAAA